MNSILSAQLPDTYEGTMLLAFQVFMIGLAAALVILIFLWGARALFRRSSARGASAEDQNSATAPITHAAAAGGDEIIAVIAAAIAMAESENPGAKFRVVSFKRK